MFRSIKESLIEVLGNEKLRPVHEKGTLAICWKECVGDSINENTTIKGFKNGVLVIKAKTPVWRNELLFQKEKIKQKLNTKLDKNKIKDIRFV